MRGSRLLGAVTLMLFAASAAQALQSYDEGVAPTRPSQDAEGAQFEAQSDNSPRNLPPATGESEQQVDVNAILDELRRRVEEQRAARTIQPPAQLQINPADRGEADRLIQIMRESEARVDEIDQLLAGYQQGGVIVQHEGTFVVITREQLARLMANQILTDGDADFAARNVTASVEGSLYRSQVYAAQLAADRTIYANQYDAARRAYFDLLTRDASGWPVERPPAPQTAAERFGVPPEVAARAVDRREIRYEECWHAGGNPNSGCTMIQHSVWVYTLDNGQSYWDRAEYDARRAELARQGYSIAWSRER